MKIKLACLGLGALLAATAGAQAGDFSYGAGLRDRVDVPAPIPVPAPMPVPEGFTYYLRADLGWSFSEAPSFSETGAIYGTIRPTSTYSGLLNRSVATDDVFIGTIGVGAYLTPHLRGDLTLDFRSHQDIDANATYLPGPIAGAVSRPCNTQPRGGPRQPLLGYPARGAITPYVGAGVGLVYNDLAVSHLTTEIPGVAPPVKTGSGSETSVSLAAALMAGVSFSSTINGRWM